MNQQRGSYLLKVSEPYVMMPARVAAMLEAELGAELSRLRVRKRGVDPEASQVLADIRAAAIEWAGSGSAGTSDDGPPEPRPESNREHLSLTPSQAAGRVGVSDRAIRKAIHTGRLPAAKVDGAWQITRDDLRHFQASRAS